jgi:hypothetical protein
MAEDIVLEMAMSTEQTAIDVSRVPSSPLHKLLVSNGKGSSGPLSAAYYC